MDNYNNILDFFLYVKDMKMCTTPFCSTCGAMEYRNLCKKLGKDRVKELLEATTTEDLSHVNPALWYDPMTIMLYDGFKCKKESPIMQMYEKGYDWLVIGDAKDILYEKGEFQVYSATGSIFEERNVDVLALFENPGLATLPIRIKEFLNEKKIAEEQSALIPCEGKHGNVKAVYYAKATETKGIVHEVAKLLRKLLDTVSEAGYSTIAMNGIRTQGYSEYDNLRSIKEWIEAHPNTSIRKILLIDKRAGFTKLAHKRDM